MTPNIRLYYFPGACSLAPHVLLREAGLSFELTSVPLMTGFPPELLKLNPKGQVPFMTLDDSTITENPAIMTAISQLAPSKNLLGATPMDTVRCYEWLNFLSGKLHGQGYGMIFKPGRFINDEAQLENVREMGKKTVRDCYKMIDAKLEGKKFAVGDAFTAVDAYLLPFYRWGASGRFDMRAEFPHYAKFVDGITQRDAVIEAVKAEGLDSSGKSV